MVHEIGEAIVLISAHRMSRLGFGLGVLDNNSRQLSLGRISSRAIRTTAPVGPASA